MLTSTRCLLLATLPYAMAEFDKCARASGIWAGVDQVPYCRCVAPPRSHPASDKSVVPRAMAGHRRLRGPRCDVLQRKCLHRWLRVRPALLNRRGSGLSPLAHRCGQDGQPLLPQPAQEWRLHGPRGLQWRRRRPHRRDHPPRDGQLRWRPL
eukprot:scaffold79508_cov55-Phaeocystis_antarctica.AAC.2